MAKASGGDPLRRIRPLVEMMEQSGDADEFLEHAKLEMFTDQVFTFTPKGDLIALPRGATPIDADEVRQWGCYQGYSWRPA